MYYSAVVGIVRVLKPGTTQYKTFRPVVTTFVVITWTIFLSWNKKKPVKMLSPEGCRAAISIFNMKCIG